MNSSSNLTSIKFDEIGFSVRIESLIPLSVVKKLKCEFAYAAILLAGSISTGRTD